jgi:hypothetical protein
MTREPIPFPPCPACGLTDGGMCSKWSYRRPHPIPPREVAHPAPVRKKNTVWNRLVLTVRILWGGWPWRSCANPWLRAWRIAGEKLSPGRDGKSEKE